jgi:hypothetical protein
MVSESIDAFWLLLGIRTGLPTVVFLLSAMGLLVDAAAKVWRRHPNWLVKRYAKAWFISFIAFMRVGCTVHFWNVLSCYFFFFLGFAGWIRDPVRRQPVALPTAADAPRRRRRARPAETMPSSVPLPA